MRIAWLLLVGFAGPGAPVLAQDTTLTIDGWRLSIRPGRYTAFTSAEDESSVGLVVRCTGNESELFILWNRVFDGKEPYVTLQFDGDTTFPGQWWELSEDGRATFWPKFPEAVVPRVAAAQFVDASTLPADTDETLRVRFRTEGLKKAIEQFPNDCHWIR